MHTVLALDEHHELTLWPGDLWTSAAIKTMQDDAMTQFDELGQHLKREGEISEDKGDEENEEEGKEEEEKMTMVMMMKRATGPVHPTYTTATATPATVFHPSACTSSPSQQDRANISSTYTHATASVYSRPSVGSSSSVDPSSPVFLKHTPHDPVDGPEALSLLSARFPQVPTGVPSRLRVTNTNMEDESESEGMSLGGEKTLSHVISPVSPLLYASFGANERYSGYTEETEMESSGYSESDDGHTSRRSQGLRSDAGSLRSPMLPTDGSSAASALPTYTESKQEQRWMGMWALKAIRRLYRVRLGLLPPTYCYSSIALVIDDGQVEDRNRNTANFALVTRQKTNFMRTYMTDQRNTVTCGAPGGEV
ncbi:hypothetical protein BDR07DRAFT_1379463 [Suillus spraguei]|nr:hypothetical protein BDR07DRAFT_1379463 [Suillus spraguei]